MGMKNEDTGCNYQGFDRAGVHRSCAQPSDSRIFINSKLKGAQKNPTEVGSLSGAEWIRTTDSRIFSPMLYQLSYSTKISVGKSRYFFEKAKFKLKFVVGIF